MSGIMNLVSRFARGRTAGAPTRTRRPAAGHAPGGAPHTRGGTAGLEGMARKLVRRAR